MTRRTILSSVSLAAAVASTKTAIAKHTEWRPKLGILGPYTRANVDQNRGGDYKDYPSSVAADRERRASRRKWALIASPIEIVGGLGLTALALYAPVKAMSDGDDSVTDNASHIYRITARDAAGNESAPGTAVSATFGSTSGGGSGGGGGCGNKPH